MIVYLDFFKNRLEYLKDSENKQHHITGVMVLHINHYKPYA